MVTKFRSWKKTKYILVLFYFFSLLFSISLSAANDEICSKDNFKDVFHHFEVSKNIDGTKVKVSAESSKFSWNFSLSPLNDEDPLLVNKGQNNHMMTRDLVVNNFVFMLEEELFYTTEKIENFDFENWQGALIFSKAAMTGSDVIFIVGIKKSHDSYYLSKQIVIGDEELSWELKDTHIYKEFLRLCT
ncbi:hypothetical protein J8L86_11425 [Shewanella sp. MMG014]|uniref:hypothetical protein n=1 Tax=Shewanella sp. MMG014 TaxID=2822691 RepID=UPI001B38A3E2|nr:hypothetical protein [Shewanella sp. MMG014]MBQ4890459.1 hypothetical protein [Shewanella sp. MMG014]